MQSQKKSVEFAEKADGVVESARFYIGNHVRDLKKERDNLNVLSYDRNLTKDEKGMIKELNSTISDIETVLNIASDHGIMQTACLIEDSLNGDNDSSYKVQTKPNLSNDELNNMKKEV